MEKENCVINCGVAIELLCPSGPLARSQKFKSAVVSVVRNQFREIFLSIKSGEILKKYLIKDVTIHKKFIHEGKATIKFKEPSMNVLLSNAPASQLSRFIKILFIKITSSKCSPKPGVREKLLSTVPNAVEDISPVNTKDVSRVRCASSKGTKNTPIIVRQPNCRVEKKPEIVSVCSMSDDQKRVLEAVLSGKNVFFTGSAGTGKSYLLRCIINSLTPDVTATTASTGAAACLIGGVTLHSFAGIGTGEGSHQQCRSLASRPTVAPNWKRCKHLIIDEISMLSSDYFEKVEWTARQIRESDKVFGGIQLIICGDFLQLPPVSKSSTRFCFLSPVWDRCGFYTFHLKTVFRQTDSTFIKILNSIRFGIVTSEVTEALQKTSLQSIESSDVVATRLCSLTEEARQINLFKLNKLPGNSRVFNAEDFPESGGKMLDDCTPVERVLSLKVGAQVMLLKNLSVARGLVNGARGVVQSLSGADPVVKFLSGESFPIKIEKWTVKTPSGAQYSRKQVPLRLAWAFSIHKSQGLTLDCVEMNLSNTFEAGQAYVALSRAKSLDTLRVIGFDPKQVWADPGVVKFYKKLDFRVTDYIALGKKIEKKSKKTLKFM